MRFFTRFFQNPVAAWLAILVSAFVYFLLCYNTPRSDFYQLTGLFTVVFLAYIVLVKSRFRLIYLFGVAIGFRLILLFSLPALSDDYFRFIWDGRLLLHHENPYQKLPANYIESGTTEIPGINEALYKNLNSQRYFSVYPPVCQFVFWVATAAFPDNETGNVVVMRLFLLLAEAMSCWFLYRILVQLKLDCRQVLWYVLNPLVITELTGNLHFEALLICFWLAAFWFLLIKKPLVSAVFLGLAVGVKLLPLLFLPFLIRPLGFKKAVVYGVVTIAVFAALFLPFLTPDLIKNIGSSVELYFQKFEFNASIYYLLREIGFWLYGYNQIAVIGKILSVATFAGVMLLALQKRNSDLAKIPESLLLALALYFLLATTVHPWYLTTLVAFASLTNRRFAMVWSAMVVLSYASYQTSAYHENLSLVALEYLVVLGWFGLKFYHLRLKKATAETNLRKATSRKI
jgi:alpha-1,6-mannosyltransferase